MKAATLLTALIGRAVAYGLLWLVLAGPTRWYYGVMVVAAALALSWWLTPPRAEGRPPLRLLPRRAVATVRLTGWFLWRSLIGGWDVARRVVRRQLPIDPTLQTMPLLLPAGGIREVAALIVGLLPGSVVVSIGEDDVLMHVLATDLGTEEQWAMLQRLLADAAGVEVLSR